MITTILILIGIAVGAALLYAMTRPDIFRVKRTVRIKAAPEAIYPYMSDFHQGALWVPYEQKDPAMKRTFTGPENGKGSVYEFDGNKEVGTGRLEIIEAVPPSRVVMTLDMRKPFKGHNIVEYAIAPAGDASEVSWTLSGKNNYLGKVLGIFCKMDTMVGNDFTTGLTNLKTLVEKG